MHKKLYKKVEKLHLEGKEEDALLYLWWNSRCPIIE